MENRVAIIGIILEDKSSVKDINDILHQYSDYIIGRMGIPYIKKNIYVINIVLDAPLDIINALSGKIGKIKGVTTKTISSNK
ncbi:MAG: iron-only hydrogenase system regulator [Clostridium sp.]|nr:iron-only hydrogenase system regulator [Clostridium sp.]MDY3828492.1 TM1266 family iron-only hydrogenase system putative regulator [Clostridium sp.]